MKTETGRLAYLDGLRGMAAVLVVVYHLMIAFYPATYTRGTADLHTAGAVEWLLHDTPIGIIINGGFAVAVFLVVSGYVASLQFKRRSLPAQVAASILKRFTRFLLPILFINLVVMLLLWFNQRWNVAAAQSTLSWWWLGSQWQFNASLATAVSQSVGSLFQMYPLNEVYNSSVWTMPFFFLGAVMVAMTLLLTSQWSKRWLLYALLAAALIRSNYWLLFLGMLLEQYGETLKAVLKRPMIRWGMAPLVWLGNYPQDYTTAHWSGWYGWLPILSFTYTSSFYQGVAAVAFLLLLQQAPLIQRVLSRKEWQFLGKISFSLYLFHIVVINSLASWLFVHLSPVFSYSLSVLVTGLISFGVILIGSWLIYETTEKHASTVADGIYKWLVQ